MTIGVLFFVIFGVGPVLFLALVAGRLRAAGGIIVALGLGVVALQMGMDGMLLAAAWLAWIGTLAFAAYRLQRTELPVRWLRLAGAAGSTAPWFGLVSASWIAG